MKCTFLTLACLTLFAVSCKKTSSEFFIPDGTYNCTFQRQTSTAGSISNVSITFSDNNYTGQSGSPRYPALCNGTYKAIESGKLNFQNACFWTADFDWSLILSGNYKINVDSHYIEISRDYNNGVKDIYKLTKQ
jgi:hypothetical protein